MGIDNIEQLFLLKLNNESISLFKKMIGEKYISEIASIQPKEGEWMKVEIRPDGAFILHDKPDEKINEEYKKLLIEDDKENGANKFMVVDENFKIPTFKKTGGRTMKKSKKRSKNKTRKKKKKKKKKKRKKKKRQRGGGGTHSKPSSKPDSAVDMLSEGLFGVSTKKLTEMMTGKPAEPKPRLSEIFEEGQKKGEQGITTRPSTQDFVPTEGKPTSISLATGLQDDPFGLKDKFGAPSLKVGRQNTGFYARKQYIKEKTTPKIEETDSIVRENCAKLQEREKKIENLEKKTRQMGESAQEFAKTMRDIRKQQEEQKCVISGGKKSRKKRKKNRKKSTRKKLRK